MDLQEHKTSRLEHRRTGNCAMTVGVGILVAKFWGHTELEELQLWRRSIDDMLKRSEGPVITLLQVDGSAPIPAKESRDLAADGFAMLKSRNAGIAGVVLGEGIATSSKRTMMQVLVSLSGVRGPFRIFAEPDVALDWLEERVTGVADAVPTRDIRHVYKMTRRE